MEELKTKSLPELKQELNNLRHKLNQLKFDMASGKVKNIREARSIKIAVARILTVIRSQNHA